jgi:hypothetical protein
MSVKERIRLEAFARVKSGQWTVVRAAGACAMSVRQARRVWKRYCEEGDAGLVHAARGKAPCNRLSQATREKIVARHQERYADFGPTHACEKLAADGLAVGPDTLTKLLKAQGLWTPRRRRGKHRTRRERRSCFGALIQMDGSPHDWFEGRVQPCCLMVAVDDATGKTLARFHRQETTYASFDLAARWIARHGVPRAFYVDRAGIYRSDREAGPDEVLAGQKPQTQFGRAMRELGVELILANSPQAKGRVERKNGTLQDRLVKEMRLAGVNSMEAGNAFLDAGFLADHNRRYAVAPQDHGDEHRAVKSLGPGVCLEEILCQREDRVVGQDWCVRWENQFLQIGKEHEPMNLVGKLVTVASRLDGTLVIRNDGVKLNWTMLSHRPSAPRLRARKPVVNNKKWTPPTTHPWQLPLKKQVAKRDTSASAKG